jgi:hypothetical protein
METIGEPLMQTLIPALNHLNRIIVALTPDFRAFGRMMSEAFFAIVGGIGAFMDTQGGAQGVIQKFGRFILNLALLFEDFLYFIAGKDSAIGRKLGIAPGDMTIAKFLEAMFKGGTQVILPFMTEIGVAIGKGIIDGIMAVMNEEGPKIFGASSEEWKKAGEQADDFNKGAAKLLVPIFGRSEFLKWLLGTDNMPATEIDASKQILPEHLGRTSMIPATSTSNNTDARTVNVQNDIKINTPTVAAAIQKQIDFAVFNAFTNVVM